MFFRNRGSPRVHLGELLLNLLPTVLSQLLFSVFSGGAEAFFFTFHKVREDKLLSRSTVRPIPRNTDSSHLSDLKAVRK
jgi:hypothetical protein